MDNVANRFSSPFPSARVYSRKYPRLHSCAIFITKTLNVSSFSKYLTQSQNDFLSSISTVSIWWSYIYGFPFGFIIWGFFLDHSIGNFFRRTASLRFEAWYFTLYRSKKEGGEGREETDGKKPKIETFIDSSSVGESILIFERGTIILISRETFKIMYTWNPFEREKRDRREILGVRGKKEEAEWKKGEKGEKARKRKKRGGGGRAG